MTTDREMERIVRSWLEPGLTTLTDDVLDPVLDQLPATPQRRPWSPARRIADMSAYAKFAMAAAAVVVVAIVGYNLLTPFGTSQPGGVSPSVAPSASPSAEPTSSQIPVTPSGGAIDPGRYRWVSPVGDALILIPEGWAGSPDGWIVKSDVSLGHNLPGTKSEVTHVYSDACASEGRLDPIGTAADDLLTALDSQENTDTVVSDVTAGSVVGQRVEIQQAADLPDRSSCRNGVDGPMQIWADEAETGFFAFAPDSRAVAYVFEVGGNRVVFSATLGPDATQADVDEVDAIVESSRFSPR
jgi:hypothetical protein